MSHNFHARWLSIVATLLLAGCSESPTSPQAPEAEAPPIAAPRSSTEQPMVYTVEQGDGGFFLTIHNTPIGLYTETFFNPRSVHGTLGMSGIYGKGIPETKHYLSVGIHEGVIEGVSWDQQKVSRATTLDLSDGKVDDTKLKDQLRKVRDIQFLDLSDTDVTDAGLAHLAGVTTLLRLELNGTKVSDAGLKNLATLPNLQVLGLYKTKITDEGLKKHLSKLTMLQSLNLRGTKITDAGIGYLRGLRELRTLSVSGTGVTDAALENLKGFKELQYLWREDTKITEAGYKRLQKDIPKLK
jgi:Leucine-rich repeat (LRR) protein